MSVVGALTHSSNPSRRGLPTHNDVVLAPVLLPGFRKAFMVVLVVAGEAIHIAAPNATASPAGDYLCSEAPVPAWHSLPKTSIRGVGRWIAYRFRIPSWRVSGVAENDTIEGEFYEQTESASRLVLLIPGMGEDI